MQIKATPTIGYPSYILLLILCLLLSKSSTSQHFKSVAVVPNIDFSTNYVPVYCLYSKLSYVAYDATVVDSFNIKSLCFLYYNNSISSIRNNVALDSLLQELVIEEEFAAVAATEELYDSLAITYLYAMYDAESEKMVNKYAEMVETEPEEIKNLPLYRFIDHWYGVRYKYGGNTRKGIDCSAFSQRLYGNVYCLNIKRTSKQQFKKCQHFDDISEAEEGDLLFFRINHIRISHVGVYLANGYFVHATRSRGIIISSINDKYWQRRYASCGRVDKPYTHAIESANLD